MIWERLFIVANVVTAALLVIAGLSLFALLSAVGQVLRKVKAHYYVLITDEGPELHTTMPDFEARTIAGTMVRSADFQGRDVVLLLVTAECAPCVSVLAAMERVKASQYEPPNFVIVVEGAPEVAARVAGRYKISEPIIADEDGLIRSGLGVTRTPYGFSIDGAGVVRMKGVLSHGDQLEALLSRRGRSVGTLSWESIPDPDTPDIEYSHVH
jgi:peroxiredoxin